MKESSSARLVREVGALRLADEDRIVATIGNFDGVHRGHQQVFAKLREIKSRLEGEGSRVLLLTLSFDPHPVSVVKGVKQLPLLNTMEQKALLLGEQGVDILYIYSFTRESASISAAEFLEDFFLSKLRVYHLVVGADVAVGRGREGDAKFLKGFLGARQVGFDLVSTKVEGGERISSKRIRELVEGGDVVRAEELLGRRFMLEGWVGSGARRGRELGFPTANLEEVSQIVPARGVYAVFVHLPQVTLPGVTNIGVRPTFGGGEPAIETHILEGEKTERYGERMRIELVERLRDERSFSGPNELSKQIAADCSRALEALKGKHGNALFSL